MKSILNTNQRFAIRAASLVLVIAILIITSARLRADTGSCSGASVTLPFTDVQSGNTFFCSIASAFFSGLTNGTTATTYSPGDFVTREQMAAFTTRTLDQALRRGSQRAAFGKFWLPQSEEQFGVIEGLVNAPDACATDGIHVFVGTSTGDIKRVDISTWVVDLTLHVSAGGIGDLIVARGKVYALSGGQLIEITFTATGGTAATVASGLGNGSSMAFDGDRFFVNNFSAGFIETVRLNPGGAPDRTQITGFNQPEGVVFDGTNFWVTCRGDDSLKRVNPATGAKTSFGLPNSPGNPGVPLFDGQNVWVPTDADKIYVYRTDGTLLATLTGNGLNSPNRLAFDGERVVATSNVGTNAALSVWSATSLAPLGSVSVSTPAHGICSDGVNFFVTSSTQSNVVGKLWRL